MKCMLVLIASVMLSGSCSYTADNRSDPTQSCLAVEDASWDHYDSVKDLEKKDAILGEARNNCGVTIGSAYVEFNLFDSGAQVGSTIASARNLAPGDVWRFKANVAVTNAYVDSFKLSKVSAYK